MKIHRLAPLALKYVARHPLRSALTIAGVATAMFLFCAVQAIQNGVDAATRKSAEDTTLVVYRENRYCPFTSQLPEDYTARIARVSGVRSVTPIMVVVNSCRPSLDVVTFRGIPPETTEQGALDAIQLAEGSLDEWRRRTDAAIVGRRLAERRGVRVGDRLSAAGVTVTVAGILATGDVQDENVAYVHLGYIQRAAGKGQGIVTQFNVQVDDPARIDDVAAAIDAEFRTSQAPTWTAGEKTFVARAISDMADLVHFAGLLGWGSLVAIFALVANAIVLSVQERVRDHAVMQTLGFKGNHIAALIVMEGVFVSLIGGGLGLIAATALLRWGRYTFSAEGVSVAIHAGFGIVVAGLLLCVVIGVLAGLVPAWRAARLETAECFRAV